MKKVSLVKPKSVVPQPKDQDIKKDNFPSPSVSPVRLLPYVKTVNKAGPNIQDSGQTGLGGQMSGETKKNLFTPFYFPNKKVQDEFIYNLEAQLNSNSSFGSKNFNSLCLS